jgi:hypothetical protein
VPLFCCLIRFLIIIAFVLHQNSWEKKAAPFPCLSFFLFCSLSPPSTKKKTLGFFPFFLLVPFFLSSLFFFLNLSPLPSKSSLSFLFQPFFCNRKPPIPFSSEKQKDVLGWKKQAKLTRKEKTKKTTDFIFYMHNPKGQQQQ